MLKPEQQIFEQIKKAQHILISFNKNWNGDALASALGLFCFLQKMGKKVSIAAEQPVIIPDLPFLRHQEEISGQLDDLRQFIISLDISQTKAANVKYKVEGDKLNFIISPQNGFYKPTDVDSHPSNFLYDLIFVLDSPDLESLGKIYENNTELFFQVPIINIDHQAGNEEFGQINLVRLTAVATAEILFDLFADYSRELIDEDIATDLLAGIIIKTKSFKTSNITPQALSAASQLIALGGRRDEIITHLYRSRSLNVLKLWGRVLARLSSSLDDKLIWTALNQGDFSKTGTKEEDLNEVIDELIVNIPSAKLIVIIYEQQIGEKIQNEKAESDVSPVSCRAIIYCNRNIDAMDLVKEYHPQGSRCLARINIDKTVLEAEKELIEKIEAKLKKLAL